MPGITYALIISIQHYNQPKHFKEIRYAGNDAAEMEKALTSAGVDPADITVLPDGKATQAAIKQEILKLSKKVTDQDRIIFYFTGHGAFDSDENWLLSVDTYNDNITQTSVSINYILGTLKKSPCKRNILFLDCCHSGFEPGDDTKSRDQSFLADELIYNSRNEEYTIGFASCKSNQTSITHPELKHSVWTYFLIKALKGDAGLIYEHRLLYSDKLQTYLTNETREYVSLNTEDRKDQVPVSFGNQTDKFIVVDLNEIFNERLRLKESEGISLTNISIMNKDDGKVKDLPGYNKKRGHHVPDNYNYNTDKFIKKIGTDIIEEEISELSTDIRQKLGYKLKEVQAHADEGSGTINTPNFTYSIEISHSKSNASEYIITRKLNNFKPGDITLNPEFNKVFSSYFDELRFAFSKNLNIEKFINNFEDIEDKGALEIDYDPSNLTYCTISVKGIGNELQLRERSLSVYSPYKTNPISLINSFKEVRAELSGNPELNLLDL